MTAHKGQTAAVPKHGCCGDKAAAESHNGASKLVDRERPKQIVPSKIAESACCGGSSKGRPVDRRVAASRPSEARKIGNFRTRCEA